MIKPPSPIAPAAITANSFFFIVCFVCCLEALLRAFKDMTAHVLQRLQNFLQWLSRCPLRRAPNPQVLGTSTSTREVVTKAQSHRSCLMVWMRSRSHG